MTTVLIIGASRGVGLETVMQALEAGYEVRALSRNAHSIQITHRNLEKISASAIDSEAIHSAVDGCDAVISVIGIMPTLKPVDIFSNSAKVLISAMSAVGVKRLIAVTGLGAGNSKGTGGLLYSKIFQPFLLGSIYADKDREEDLIQNSTLEWTIVRPGILTRLPKKGNYQVLTEPESWSGGFISRSDVADFLVKQIVDRKYIGKTPLLIN